MSTSEHYIVYEISTGKIRYTGSSFDWPNLVLDPGDAIIEGVANPQLHKIVDGSLVEQDLNDRAEILNMQRKKDIYDERLRRVQKGFMYAGKMYDFDVTSQNRISGAATLANAAMMSGAQAGDLRWHGGTSDFIWITQDNTFVPMDAPTLLSMGQAAAEHERAHVFAARALKDDPSLENVFDDIHWP